MTQAQHAWFLIYGWSLGLGFILAIIVIVAVIFFIDSGKFRNPFGPWIRAREARATHKRQLEWMHARASEISNGLDPEYVTFLERKAHERV